MVLSKDLLEILVCPQCKGEIVPDDNHDKLLCHACKLAYPVRDGIPVMLVDEALPFSRTPAQTAADRATR
ncbi:MAG: Trm112 family protein [Desulfuromonadales bacterium]|nr:Trm112 family protein [Desulfuromonadales bacterium]